VHKKEIPMKNAPKGKFRVIGSDAQSIWIEKDFGTLKRALKHADTQVKESHGYDSMSVYNDSGSLLYSKGLSVSVERTYW